MKTVRKILNDVKMKGDQALRFYTKKFDGIDLKKIKVSESQIKKAASLVNDDLKSAIRQAKKNIEKFHNAQIEKTQVIETMLGIKCWRRSVPIERVGLYIPGGRAPLFSTVLMLGVPAQIAGCKKIILTSPPSPLSKGEGGIDPAILYTASLCGITDIYRVGGAQAIAAMAYGTKTIPKVQKIIGPGNQYVTTAKQLVQLEGVAIDMPAGPSELLVIADESAISKFVAADLLSQAEHGPDSKVTLLSNSPLVINEVKKELMKQGIMGQCKLIKVKTIEQAIDISNGIAPEHLILACKNAEAVANKIVNAGSVFIGNYSACAAGDYASGTNHTLPTKGYAAMYSGVSLDSFVKKITYQKLTKEGLKKISNTVMIMAEAEGLIGHKNAIACRLI